METLNKMTTGAALAILHKAYLKSIDAKNYDMRSFEFFNENKQFTKIPQLLTALQQVNLSEKETEAKLIIVQTKSNALENDLDFVKELLKK